MDSVTQFVLGASVGEAVLGKKAGNKAIVWGGIGGTIPDLDVFLNNFFDEATQLMVHRGISHSLFFPIIVAPIIGYWVSKWHHKSGKRIEWMQLFFWTIFTHPLLDLFTGYGTGLFTPFYDHRFQLDTIFIIDPGYTLPLFLSVLTVLFLKRDSRLRQRINWIGIGLAHAYLVFTVYHKIQIQAIVDQNITKNNFEVVQYMTAPSPLNNFLWWVLIESDNQYHVAYYSFFDSTTDLSFRAFEKNMSYLSSANSNEQVKTLIKFSKGFFSLEKEDNILIFNDLRFGPSKGWFDPPKDFIFSFDIQEINGNIYIERRSAGVRVEQEDFIRLFDRIKGI